jgi:hypothetical protein
VTPHLRGYVRAYVDRALPPAMLHLYDRHLVCCVSCRDAVDRERRIVAALRSDTGMPTSLRSSLLGLAAAQTAPGSGHDGGPRIPLPPMGVRHALPTYDPVPTVRPGAPALHRSPMRAAVVASLAAGASVAAAWGLAVSPVPGGTRLPSAGVPVASLGSSPSTTGSGMSALLVSRLGSSARGSGSTASTGAGAVSGAGSTAAGPDAPASSRLAAVSAPYWVVTNRVVNRPPQVGQVRSASAGSAESTP